MESTPYMQDVILVDALISLGFLVLVLTVRFLLVRTVRRNVSLPAAVRRRWLVQIRNIAIFVLIAGLVFIWAHPLRTLAFSLVAMAVAIVLATKELILCFTGSALRGATDAYGIGDRVEIGEYRGDVIDQNWFATSLLETGPGRGPRQYTGRKLVIPNGLLLSTPVANETFLGRFSYSVLRVPLSIDEDWSRAETILLESARSHCGPFLSGARRHLEEVKKQQGIDTPSVEPRVVVEFPEPRRINLLLRFAAPAGDVGRIEQAILRHFVTEFYGENPAPSLPAGHLETGQG